MAADTCARCGHRTGGCDRCGRYVDFLGAQVNDDHYCHLDDAPSPSCYELASSRNWATS